MTMPTLKQTRLLLPLALCLALPAAAKPAPKAPPARAQIQALYNKINAAAARKEVDGIYEFDSDDYTLIDRKGHVHDASEGRQEMEQALEIVDSLKAVTVIQSFTGTDTEATVAVKEHVVARVGNTTTHRAVKITADDISRDHWIKTEDGWRRTRTRILSGKNAFQKNF
jgi:ketosteroid isomerase-like protein